MTPALQESIYKYLMEHPECGRNQAARYFNVNPSTLQLRITQNYNFSFLDRYNAIKANRKKLFEDNWPEIKKALDTESVCMQVVANRYGISRDVMRQMVIASGYDIKARTKRLKQRSHKVNPRKGVKAICQSYQSESMAGTLSLKAHTLLMNEWGDLVT